MKRGGRVAGESGVQQELPPTHGAGGEGMEIANGNSEFRSQNSGVRSQETGVRRQKTEVGNYGGGWFGGIGGVGLEISDLVKGGRAGGGA